MPKYPMTDLIARRDYALSVASELKPLVLEIGKPAPFPDTPDRDWYCPWVIRGLDSPIEHWAGGVDALQALLMALSGARADLLGLARRGKLTWFEEEYLGLELVGPAA